MNSMKFIIREVIKSDVPTFHKFATDREVAYFNNTDMMESFESFHKRYEPYFLGQIDNLKIFTICIDEMIIGKMDITYDLKNRSGEFNIVIGNKNFWGRGYGLKALNVLFRYAFNNLGLNRLSCKVYAFNYRMMNLLRKLKMHVDGVLREAEYVHGRFTDVYIFSILRKEYEGDV